MPFYLNYFRKRSQGLGKILIADNINLLSQSRNKPHMFAISIVIMGAI